MYTPSSREGSTSFAIARSAGVYRSVRSTKFAPTSGVAPVKLIWSLISTGVPNLTVLNAVHARTGRAAAAPPIAANRTLFPFWRTRIHAPTTRAVSEATGSAGATCSRISSASAVHSSRRSASGPDCSVTG